MLKLLMKLFYKNLIYTDEKELFYKVYRRFAIFNLIRMRKLVGVAFFCLFGIISIFFIRPWYIGILFVDIGLFLLILQMKEEQKNIQSKKKGIEPKALIRNKKIERHIKNFISQRGKALGKKEWKEIKNKDIDLYNELRSDESNHLCYYYSLAKIIKDCTLIWGAVEEPFVEGKKFYAHAVVMRNGYIYDSNMSVSIKYEDFMQLYHFKTYKCWQYEKYSKENFRASERKEFRKWCLENGVLLYDKF